MSDIILSGARNIVSSDNPMKAGNECFLCILCAADDVENQAILSQYFAPGMVVANSPDKELPVYPSMDNIGRDTIEATFNPDIDKTMHFDLGDLEDLNIFRVKLITDANRTSTGLVYTVNAVMIMERMDMVPIKTEIKLKAVKYGKTLDPNTMSASRKQKYEESGIDKIIKQMQDNNMEANEKMFLETGIEQEQKIEVTDVK